MSLKFLYHEKMNSRLKKTKSKGVQKKRKIASNIPKILEIDTVSNLSPNLSVLFISYVYNLARMLAGYP